MVDLGRMGKAIVQRLHTQGFATDGWNRSGQAQQHQDQLGVACVATLTELVEHVDVVITSLFDDTAAHDVLDQISKLDLSGKL